MKPFACIAACALFPLLAVGLFGRQNKDFPSFNSAIIRPSSELPRAKALLANCHPAGQKSRLNLLVKPYAVVNGIETGFKVLAPEGLASRSRILRCYGLAKGDKEFGVVGVFDDPGTRDRAPHTSLQSVDRHYRFVGPTDDNLDWTLGAGVDDRHLKATFIDPTTREFVTIPDFVIPRRDE